MKHTLTLALLVILLLAGCKDSVPPKIIGYQGYDYVRLDVIQEAVSKEGVIFYIKPPKEAK